MRIGQNGTYLYSDNTVVRTGMYQYIPVRTFNIFNLKLVCGCPSLQHIALADRMRYHMLTYDIVCICTTSYAYVRHCMLTYDIVCWHTTSYTEVLHRMLTYDIVCWRTTSYADIRHRMWCYNYSPFLTLCCMPVGRWPFSLQEGTCLLNETRCQCSSALPWRPEQHPSERCILLCVAPPSSTAEQGGCRHQNWSVCAT